MDPSYTNPSGGTIPVQQPSVLSSANALRNPSGTMDPNAQRSASGSYNMASNSMLNPSGAGYAAPGPNYGNAPGNNYGTTANAQAGVAPGAGPGYNTGAPSAVEAVRNGPVVQTVLDEANKTTSQISNLASARNYRPAYPAATGQPLTHYHSFFWSLIGWDNPRASAIAYFLLSGLIFAFRYLPLVRWAFKLTWLTLLCTVVAEVAGKTMMGTGFTTSFRPRSYFTVSPNLLTSLIGDVNELINFFLIEAQRIIFVENIPASIGAFAAAFSGYHLIKIVPYWGLALIGLTGTFFVPLLYTSNQELIDSQLHNATQVLDAQSRQLRQAAEKHTAQGTSMAKQYIDIATQKAQNLMNSKKPVTTTAKPATTGTTTTYSNTGSTTGVSTGLNSAGINSTAAGMNSGIATGPTKAYRDADFPTVPRANLHDPNPLHTGVPVQNSAQAHAQF